MLSRSGILKVAYPRFLLASVMIPCQTTSLSVRAIWSPVLNEETQTIFTLLFITDSMQQTNDSSKMDSKESNPSFDILASMRTWIFSKRLYLLRIQSRTRTLAVSGLVTRSQVCPYGLGDLGNSFPTSGLADVVTAIWALT